MGSPLSREITDYDDIHDSLYYDVSAKPVTKNAMVQENLMLPMASDVPGLAEYFYSFLGKPAPEFAEKREFSPAIRKKTATYDLVDGKQTFVHYTVSWEKEYGEDAVYTLVSFDPEDYLNTFVPIKTIYPSEQAIGYIGTVTRNMGNGILYNNDGYAAGIRTFVVTAITPDGHLYCSDPVEYIFP